MNVDLSVWKRFWSLASYSVPCDITETRLFKHTEIFSTKKKKKWKFSEKKSDIFHISAQNIDCGTR